MKVSFDFDDTLTETKGINLLLQHLKNGDEVFIITRRRKSFNEPVLSLAKKYGINRSHVIFTGGEMKWKTILRLGIQLHYDNNQTEIDLIQENTNAQTKKI